jgi:hypothetical protein
MPLIVEHLRRDPKSHPDNPHWDQVEHQWTFELLVAFSTLIEEDGGPELAMASGYGQLWDRKKVSHTFTMDYPLPNDQPPIKKGDVVQMWRDMSPGGRRR